MAKVDMRHTYNSIPIVSEHQVKLEVSKVCPKDCLQNYQNLYISQQTRLTLSLLSCDV